MYVNRLEFSFAGDHPPENLSDMALSYLAALSTNGQILGEHWPLYLENERCVSIVQTPELESLDEKYHSEWVRKEISKLTESRITVFSHPIAEALDSRECCKCADPSGYALFTGFLALTGMPVHCLDCFDPVPLYKFPTLARGEYYDLLMWESAYVACDTLFINSRVLEKSADRQLDAPQSALSKEGRKVAAEMAKLVGKPFYYYLHRFYCSDPDAETERPCPSCGGAWLLEEPLHHLFDFRCDRCRLLSNIASDVR